MRTRRPRTGARRLLHLRLVRPEGEEARVRRHCSSHPRLRRPVRIISLDRRLRLRRLGLRREEEGHRRLAPLRDIRRPHSLLGRRMGIISIISYRRRVRMIIEIIRIIGSSSRLCHLNNKDRRRLNRRLSSPRNRIIVRIGRRIDLMRIIEDRLGRRVGRRRLRRLDRNMAGHRARRDIMGGGIIRLLSNREDRRRQGRLREVMEVGDRRRCISSNNNNNHRDRGGIRRMRMGRRRHNLVSSSNSRFRCSREDRRRRRRLLNSGVVVRMGVGGRVWVARVRMGGRGDRMGSCICRR